MTSTPKALFLDRDGVINVNHGYVYQPEDIDFIDGIFDLCKAARAKQYRIIIITNQSGIARRYYSKQQFSELTHWLHYQFWKQGIVVQHTYFCPHHPKQSGPFGFKCTCRKPRPGMLFKAQRDFGIDLGASLMVGDNKSDMLCAQNAGISKRVLFCPSGQVRTLLEPGKQAYYRSHSLRQIRQLL